VFSERIFANFAIAIEAVIANKLRSMLTALGIIFGVAAVIAMMAIGNGAQQEIMEQIKLVGVNNIVINPIIEQTEEEIGEELGFQEAKKFSPGLTLRDVEGIKKIIPSIAKMSPEILLETYIIKNGIRRSAKLVGVEPAYFELANFELREGRMFNQEQLKKGEPVCIIGKSIQSRFFPTRNPIGQSIKCGQHWLKIIGILEERLISENSIANLGIRDYNMDVYTPIKTVLVRYENRDLVTQSMLLHGGAIASTGRFRFFGGAAASTDTEDEGPPDNYHQLDTNTHNTHKERERKRETYHN